MSLTHEDASAAILEAFSTAWGSTTPIAFMNLAFEPPEKAP